MKKNTQTNHCNNQYIILNLLTHCNFVCYIYILFYFSLYTETEDFLLNIISNVFFGGLYEIKTLKEMRKVDFYNVVVLCWLCQIVYVKCLLVIWNKQAEQSESLIENSS